VLESSDTCCRGEGGFILQNIVPYPLIANNDRGDDGDPMLWLRRSRGDALTSPSLVLTPLGVEGGRITMIEIDSLTREAMKGRTLRGGGRFLYQYGAKPSTSLRNRIRYQRHYEKYPPRRNHQ